MSGTFTFFLSLVLIFANGCTDSAPAQKIRRPAVAGAFYPADKNSLQQMVEGYLANTKAPRINEPILALIAPHAGYVYSGQVAAESYAQLRGRKIKRVVVIAPSHFEHFRGVSIYDGDAYATPLGNISVDKTFARELSQKSEVLFLGSRGHDPASSGRGEHSLEVQLPFLQVVLDDFKLVPVIMGEQSYETCRALALTLAGMIRDKETIIIASSDLSHYHAYAEAAAMDKKVLDAVHEWDYYNLSRNLQARIWEACGGGPIVTAMMAAERLGATEASLLRYANSGDVPAGDKSRVVGYSAFAFFKATSGAKQADYSLNAADRQTLLAIAKKAVREKVLHKRIYEPKTNSPALLQSRGAFVTLTKEGRLRGCIGYTAPLKALYLTVRDVAISAALSDPRFNAVGKEELDQLDYEISVLSPFRHVRDVKEIEIGKHGLLIKRGDYAGLLLPQVAADYGWDRQTFLQQTCRKAGLPANAWKDEDSDIFIFTAFVFSK